MIKYPSFFDIAPPELMAAFVAQQRDMQAWRKAYALLELKRPEIESYLNSLDEASSADMRRRLNTVRENRKARGAIQQQPAQE